jgi:hypothetical protein
MNRNSFIVAALAAASMSSFAIEAEQFVPPTSSDRTRAEVRAELADLHLAGAWAPGNEASITPLQAAAFDAKIAQLQAQPFALASAEPAVTIEAVPLDEAQVDASADVQQMFGHPAITLDEAQVDASTDVQQMFGHPAIAIASAVDDERIE